MSSSQHQLTKNKALVMSHFNFNYASAIVSGIPKTLINIIWNMQNWAARITIGKTKIEKKQHNWNKKIDSLAPNQRKKRFQTCNTPLQMLKQPSTLVPTRTHNRKEDKTSWIAFIKSQVPARNSLYQKMHIHPQIIQCLWSKTKEYSSQLCQRKYKNWHI